MGSSSATSRPCSTSDIGLVSSSLGTFGANGCPETPPPSCTTKGDTISNNDHGHLVTRKDPCGTGDVPTYQGLGFLAWDPAQKLVPPGEAQVGDPTAKPPAPGLSTSLHDLVIGDGQLGCGFESQDEAWYRFLVDPTPYQSIALVNNAVVVTGIDQALLQQRRDFLRPDSLLAVVVVSDETDTSIKQFSSYPIFAVAGLHMPHARQECTQKGPLDPCCASCGELPRRPACAPRRALHVGPVVYRYRRGDRDPRLRPHQPQGALRHRVLLSAEPLRGRAQQRHRERRERQPGAEPHLHQPRPGEVPGPGA